MQSKIKALETVICATCGTVGNEGRREYTEEQIEELRERGDVLLPKFGKKYPCEECMERKHQISDLKFGLGIQPEGAA